MPRARDRKNPALYWLGTFLLIASTVAYNFELVRVAVDNHSSNDTSSDTANIQNHFEFDWLTEVSGLLGPLPSSPDNAAGSVPGASVFHPATQLEDVISTTLLVNLIALRVAAKAAVQRSISASSAD
jgi:hypothetical protein